MKKFTIAVLVLGLTVSLFAGEEPDPDPSKKIKVKRSPHKVYDTYLVTRKGRYKAAYKNKLFRIYNRKGQLVTENYYFTGMPNTGKLIHTKKYTYGRKGHRKSMEFFSKGKRRYRLVLTYDADGLLVKQQAFLPGKTDKPLILKYKKGKDGIIFERKVYLDGKKVISRRSYAYSPKGFKVKQYDYDGKNRLKSVMQFDINGKPIKETRYFYMFSKPSLNRLEYKYDKYGNLTEKIIYDGKGKVSTKNKYKNVY